MLEGLLVDLVPYGKRSGSGAYLAQQRLGLLSSGGNRQIVSRATSSARMLNGLRKLSAWPGARRVFGVQTKDGTPIGFFTINWIVPHSRLAMLGARIGDPNYWGGGYGRMRCFC